MSRVARQGGAMNDNDPSLNLAPQARQQLAAVAGLRWRIFVNSLRTFRGRLELASRIFIGLAFLAGGIGGAIGLGGAAWFLISQGNAEWLGASAVACVSFLAAFSSDGDGVHPECRVFESSALPAELPVVLSDSPGLRIAGSGNGCGQSVAARNRHRHWSRPAAPASLGHDCAPDLCAGESSCWRACFRLAGALAGAAAHARNHGHSFLSLYSELSADRTVDRGLRTSIHTRNAESWGRNSPTRSGRCLRAWPPPRLRARCRVKPASSVVPFLLLDVYGIAFLWLLNFRLRAEYRGENLSESARTQSSCPAGFLHSRPGWNLPGLPGPVVGRLRKRTALSQPQRADAVHPDRAPVHAGGLSKFRARTKACCSHARSSPSRWAPPTHCCLLTNLSYNNFGADGSGTQFFFASPVRFRQIMLGKNLAHLAVFALEVVLVWLGTCLLYRPPSLSA